MTRSASQPTGPQIWRMQQLLEWLRAGRPLTTRLAADAFEVSRRTIASDIGFDEDGTGDRKHIEMWP